MSATSNSASRPASRTDSREGLGLWIAIALALVVVAACACIFPDHVADGAGQALVGP